MDIAREVTFISLDDGKTWCTEVSLILLDISPYLILNDYVI